MARKDASYNMVASICDTLLQNGQTITLRAIREHTVELPNNILKHWQKWQQEREAITLKQLKEDFSFEIKQICVYEGVARSISTVHLWSIKL